MGSLSVVQHFLRFTYFIQRTESRMKLIGAIFLSAAPAALAMHPAAMHAQRKTKSVSINQPSQIQTASVPDASPFFTQSVECTPPVTTCQDGYTLEGDVCRREYSKPPAYHTCPSGGQDGARCLLSVPETLMCNIGKMGNDKRCAETYRVPAQKICPGGYSMENEQCTKKVEAPISEYCEVGTLVGDSCVLEQTVQSVLSNSYCPDGFFEETGECCKIETFDCTPPDSKPLECGDNGSGNVDWESGCTVPFYRHLTGRKTKYSYNAVVHRVPTEISVVEIPFAPVPRITESTVVQQTCQKKLVTDMIHEFHCPRGTLVGQTKCEVQDRFPVKRKCSVQGLKLRNCFRTETTRYQFHCTAGSVLRHRECEHTKYTLPTSACPPDYFLRKKVCYKEEPANPGCLPPSVLKNDKCYFTEYSAPTTTWCTTCTGSNCKQVGCNLAE